MSGSVPEMPRRRAVFAAIAQRLRLAVSERPWLMVAVLVAGSASALWTLLPVPPAWVEDVYSQSIFRWTASVVIPITSLVPFSLTFLGLVGGVAAFGVFWARNWRRLYRSRGRHRSGALWGARWLMILLVFGYAAFLFMWGAGYRRVPLAQRLELNGDPVTGKELRSCAEELLEALERVIPEVDDRDVHRALRAVGDAMRRRVESWDGAAVSVPSRVKIVPAGMLLSFGTSGVTSPLLLEAHVDGGLHEVDQVRVAAHELAHAAGFCTEAEADLVAYLVGLETEDPFARYCVTLSVFVDIVRQLERNQRERLLARLPAVCEKDLREARAARARYGVRWLSRLQSLLYDSYLKSQGVEEGIRNYSRGVRHFALAWRKGLVRLGEEGAEGGQGAKGE